MKITVQFESLDEFETHFSHTDNGNMSEEIIKRVQAAINESTVEITGAVDKVYHAGRDDVGGNFHKDIKDIDDVAEDYDEALYAEVKGMFDKLFDQYPANEVHIKKHIKDVVGDYEIRTGLSTNAYEQLKQKALFVAEILS